MGDTHLSTFIYIVVIPGVMTGIVIAYIGDRFELTSLQRLMAVLPLFLAIMTSWVFGMAALAYVFGKVQTQVYPMPRCQHCGQTLRSRHAAQCFKCGADWHET
ncbi:hypothetical protein Pla22_52320 [Rubripirellula amarantea]|uniref:Uncharacterized protein n=1 Tax=Rubripirellula amarantea TaxID=2527999 RepID=A0A5C5WCR4_9BACT|nr:hypothetical protein [Rubripirellula amarantea]TWT47865.1 hypothetical protein Pla22_52320 [Rubripirellula amarantea]